MKRQPHKADADRELDPCELLAESSGEILQTFVERMRKQLAEGAVPSAQHMRVILQINELTNRQLNQGLDDSESEEDEESKIAAIMTQVKRRVDPDPDNELGEMAVE